MSQVSREDWYPKFHLAPQKGWMNDPNGLIQFNGKFHAFYQHDPDSVQNKLIHWGHAISNDLLNWEHLPEALDPSPGDDKDGCFSGSAVDDNGLLSLVYTGYSVTNNIVKQVQMLATSKDAVNFTKHGTVLNAPDGVVDFRDPKVWRQAKQWYLVLGTKNDETGEVHTYKSNDLRKWEFDVVLAKGSKGLGYMWECPDFFPLGDKHVLIVSPQGIPSDGYLYRNLHQCGYFVGTWKPGSSFLTNSEFKLLDYGHDFYAAQTFSTQDGRQILIAWMGMWEAVFPESVHNWVGQFTLPREMQLTKNGALQIKPIREIEKLRSNAKLIPKTVLKNQYIDLEENVRGLEVILEIDLNLSSAEKFGVRLGYADAKEGGVYLFVDNQARRLVLDRRYRQYGISGYRSIDLPKDFLVLRIFFDRSSMEVFVGDGDACLSSRIYPDNDQRCLKLFAENGTGVLTKGQIWVLKN